VNIGTFIEMERHEASERAMARYYEQQRIKAARERRTSTTSTGLRPGARRISKQEAIALLMKRGQVRGAMKLANGGR
jgi:hypothetical protein